MPITYKRVLINLPEQLLAEVDAAALGEQRQRNEFVREALRDRVEKQKQLRQYSDNDIASFLAADKLNVTTTRRVKRLLKG